MALIPAARLGRDEILATLGAGGMGEVYRATGTRLGRDFASKIRMRARGGGPSRRFDTQLARDLR